MSLLNKSLDESGRPNPIVEEIFKRGEGQRGRVLGDLARALGIPEKSLNQTTEELMKTKQENAKALYDEAFKNKSPLVDSRVYDLFQKHGPIMEGALENAEEAFRYDPSKRIKSQTLIPQDLEKVPDYLKVGQPKNGMQRVITPKKGKRLPVFVREEDTRKLIANLEASSEDWKSLNARVLITIFYATGMRLQELISLKERQIDLAKSQVKVLGKGNKERIIPISRELIRMIRDYRDLKRKEFEDCGESFLVTEKGKKLYPKYAYLLVNQYLGAASTLEKKSPHVLRHTFATHLMNNGADLNAVKELLGHSSLAATQVYTHNTMEKLKKVFDQAHPKA